MCGIFALLSSREPAPSPGDDLFERLDEFLEDARSASRPGAAGNPGAAKLAARLELAKGAASGWLGLGAFLELQKTPALAERIASAARRIGRRMEDLEASLGSPGIGDMERELVHRCLVGGRDIAWQLERDVLGNLGAARDLVTEPTAVSLERAHGLNAVLNGLDRLEVRGRDSAGLAVYARFPDEARLDRFLDGGAGRREELALRADPRLGHRSLVRPPAAPNTLLVLFKVAREVGKMGDNVAFLRESIAGDGLFKALLAEPEVEIQCLGHTRWASNGVVSVANCHPVDSAVTSDGTPLPDSEGRLVACVNGDVDNYRELLERYAGSRGLDVDPAVTTDAKIVPVVVAHHVRQGDSLENAFRQAVREFEGSLAIGLMAAERPGEFLFAQKGSGQGLFFGLGDRTVAAASEVYGVVELASSYVRAEGERRAEGEIFRLRSGKDGVDLEVLAEDRFAPVDAGRQRRAEITTRDIHRGDYPHYFLKEIGESVESVRKTFRGKLKRADGGVRVSLDSEVLPPELLTAFRDGRVRRVSVVGQGTASVAGQGVAHLLRRALQRLPHAVEITSTRATELSAHGLRPDMSDTLLVAVSQSGTTTDTNRTVDLARERGAWILAIVNRRNSDLVDKAHGVLYTSDGRDVEMSVASTKAFYAQNVAGEVLALGLASALGTLDDREIQRRAAELEALPSALATSLALAPEIERLAEEHALRRPHWAVVGSGAGKIAADEIRIKLSELCYKSIAVDFLEDKKHIDLSSEPLVLVCAAGMRPEVVSDAVKEVAIFKAHRAIPLVITDEEEGAFEPYAAAVIRVPRCPGGLSHLPTIVAGHLFGYYAARLMESLAERLRALRAEVVHLRESRDPDDDAPDGVLRSLSEAALATAAEMDEALAGGELDGALTAGAASRLSRLFQLLLGRLPADRFRRRRNGNESTLDAVVGGLSTAIGELSRPIDAIKHQAKTVTVGISRGETRLPAGVFGKTLDELAVSVDEVLESHRGLLRALEPLVPSIGGATLYGLTGLDSLGRPGIASRIRVERKAGCTEDIASRCERPAPLVGSKWAAVKHREIYLGRGQADGRKILILPLVGDAAEGRVVIFHLDLAAEGPRHARLRALMARERFFDRLQAAVTERNIDWQPSLIDALDNETLLLLPPERVADEIARNVESAVRPG